jgi:hypothetical protein
MESNVADDERDFPTTPAEATEHLDFETEPLEDRLNAAEEILYDHYEDENICNSDRRLELTFRAYNPINANNGVSCYRQMPSGEWMQYSCELTGTDVAVREGAPIPVMALYETNQEGKWSLMECYKIHPDFLKDRGRLLEMLVSKLQEDVFSGVYQAQKGLDGLRFLSQLDELPGVPTEGVSYPRGEGYEPLGFRPVEPDEE